MDSSVRFPITIYYDASCPLCAREMQTLKARDRAGRLLLVDCSDPGFDDRDTLREGVGRDAMLKMIHARDPEGRWLSGVEVFAIAYAAAGLAPVAWILAHPWLLPLWRRCYPWVARHRYILSRLGLRHLFKLVPRR